ncbi:MAG: hypothetical protein OXN83_05190, partial [Oligoflexia bacterium]|nr:hypothetical protein [Oligoflexia bacterium]
MIFSSKTTTKHKKSLSFYVLRVSRHFSTSASLRLFGGLCETQKNLTTIQKEADKAFRAGYDRVLFPWNFVFHPEKQKLAEWITLNPNCFVLAVHKRSFKDFRELFHKYKNLYLELNLENYDHRLLQELENSRWPFHIT